MYQILLYLNHFKCLEKLIPVFNHFKRLKLYLLNLLLINFLCHFVQKEIVSITNYHILTGIELTLLILSFLVAPRFFKKVANLLFFEKVIYLGWQMLSLGVVYQLFFVAVIGVYFFILYSLKYELFESIYYLPETNKLNLELKSLRIKLLLDQDDEKRSLGHIVSLSENYVVIHIGNRTFIEGQSFIAKINIGGDELDLVGQISWVKGSYYCIEINENLKNNHWPILYGKIQSLGIF